MNSAIINVSEILSNEHNLVSTGFSAEYNFDGENAAQYLRELVENSTQPSPIFSGILIFEKTGDNLTIIDGIQRLTSISLLLCALCENYKNTTEKNEQAREKIFNRFLVKDEAPRLKLSPKNRVVYKKILFGAKISSKEKENSIFLAYQGFLKEIKEQNISGTELFRIISKIKFMVVTTSPSEISVREMYQALNNKDSSQLNLISDFVEKKGDVSVKLWLKTVSNYQKAEIPFENFIKDFLIVQNEGQKPNQNALYNKFQSYFAQISKYKSADDIIENICKYAKNYLKIIRSDFRDKKIKEQIDFLNQNDGQDAYPYLMEVLEDLESKHIDKEIFIGILSMINSFILKRKEDPLLNVTIDFAHLSKELNKMLVLKDYTPNLIDENKLTINEINNLSAFEV